jgi:hypothetical protein
MTKRDDSVAVVCAVVAIFLLLAPAAASAQSAAGNIAGSVVDGEGQALAAATVTATNGATGARRVTATEVDGAFRLFSLPVGTYAVVIEREGSAPSRRRAWS